MIQQEHTKMVVTISSEFDRLYQQSASEDTLMSISLHDSIAGFPGLLEALQEFLTHVTAHQGVQFLRKDQLSRSIIDSETAQLQPS